jgi:hypothetical protein
VIENNLEDSDFKDMGDLLDLISEVHSDRLDQCPLNTRTLRSVFPEPEVHFDRSPQNQFSTPRSDRFSHNLLSMLIVFLSHLSPFGTDRSGSGPDHPSAHLDRPMP